jgi:hypothetical protein
MNKSFQQRERHNINEDLSDLYLFVMSFHYPKEGERVIMYEVS